jgi:sugar phosphate isomerase/epimerase
VGSGLGIEIWTLRTRGDTQPTERTLDELRGIVAEAPFVTMHSSYDHWSWNPQKLKQEIQRAARLRAAGLVLHAGSLGLVSPDVSWDPAAVLRLADFAAQLSVRLLLENARDGAWALDWVLDELGADPEETNLGICVDVGHAHASTDLGDPPARAYLDRYREALCHLHLHDNTGTRDDHLIPGHGSVPWSTVLPWLRREASDLPVVLEIHTDGDLPAALDEARRELRSG